MFWVYFNLQGGPLCVISFTGVCREYGQKQKPLKNVALYFCPLLCQLLTNFQHFFTDTLCGQFAIMGLLHIPPHHECVLL